MRIEKITICNLTSIEGEQVIDFTTEPLKSAGLFAITGGTGAGKSTLLDAICLVLYNRAPRFEGTERIKKNDLEEDEKSEELAPGNVRNILRRGCNEGYCNVVFSITDGSVYEAGWSVRIKRTGTYDNVRRTLRRIQPGKKEYDTREIESTILQLTHLSYEQFTRTVILAQNNFANFLNAKQADKSLLLEKLTGTELYGNISKRIYEETNNVRTEYEKILEKIQGISTRQLDNETLSHLQETLTIGRGVLVRDEGIIDGINRKLNWYEKYNKAQASYEKQKILLTEARKNYNALYDKQQLLERYDKLQIFQALYHQIKDTERDINGLKEQTIEKQSIIRIQKAKLEKAKEAYNTAKNRLKESEGVYRIKESQFHTGHDLQGQISTIEQEIKIKKEELQTYQEDLRKDRDFLSARERLRDEVTKKKEDDLQQIGSIAMHRGLVEQVEYVKAQLEKMDDIYQSILTMKKEISNIRQTIQIEKKSEDNLITEQTKIDSQIKSLKEELLIHNQANQGLNSKNLHLRLERLQDTHRKAKSAMDLWQRIENGYCQLEDKTDEIHRQEIFIERIGKDIVKQESLVSIQIEALEVLRTSFMLSQSENIKELRQKLKEGTVCPVCGATHHPYHSETEQELGRILSSLEEDFKAAQAKAEQSKYQLVELQKQQAKISGQLSQTYLEKERIEKTLICDIDGWKDFEDMDKSFVGCSSSTNRENRKILILQLFENSQRELREAQNAFDSFNLHQEYINKINEDISIKEEEKAEILHKLSKIEINKQILDNRLTDTQHHLDTNIASYGDIQNLMDGIITILSWRELWTKGHDVFIQYISSLAETWNNTLLRIQEEEKQEFHLHEEISSILNRVDEKERLIEKNQTDINTKQLTIEHKQMEIRKMFGDKSIDETMQEMRNAISKNTEEEQKYYTKFEEIHQLVQNLTGELQSLDEQRQRREKDLRESRSNLDINISRFNSENSTLQYFELEKIFSDSRDWNALRAEIAHAKEELHRAEYHGEVIQRRIAELRQDTDMPNESNEESEPVLKAKLTQITSQLKETYNTIDENELLLKMHEQTLKDIESIIPEKEKLEHRLKNWEKLNSIIGSADGKRFREIAQSYTFSILVGYANRHLMDLTPRYRLRNKPGTLVLEIIDRDMLDQVRNVNSLSGGETFIVSLGLALGLSSIRSGDTNIGSLFIDEGFGNLDNASLEMVIDTLSNLQGTQGRKVGIISHTPQIRNRISPQIRLIKSMGGKSRIEVH